MGVPIELHEELKGEQRALLQMCQHLEQLTRTIEMTVAPMLQTATASKVGCSCCGSKYSSGASCSALAVSRCW